MLAIECLASAYQLRLENILVWIDCMCRATQILGSPRALSGHVPPPSTAQTPLYLREIGHAKGCPFPPYHSTHPSQASSSSLLLTS